MLPSKQYGPLSVLLQPSRAAARRGFRHPTVLPAPPFTSLQPPSMRSPAFWVSGHAGQGRAQPGSSQTCQQDTWGKLGVAILSVSGSLQSQKNQTKDHQKAVSPGLFPSGPPGKNSKGSRRRQWAYAQPRLLRPDADHQRWEKSTNTKAHMVRCLLQMPHSLSMDKYSNQLLSQSYQVCPGNAFSSSREHQGRVDPSQAVLDTEVPLGAAYAISLPMRT